MKRRDPAWRWRQALGHKIVKSKKAYTRKAKHKKPRPRAGAYSFSALQRVYERFAICGR